MALKLRSAKLRSAQQLEWKSPRSKIRPNDTNLKEIQMPKRNHLRAAILGLSFILLFLPSVAAAQEQTGSPVSGVDVSLENRADGGNLSTRTDTEGKFSVSGLKPGTYKFHMACKDCRYEGESESNYAQKYLFYLTVEGTEERKFKKTVELDKMRSGVEYTVKIAEGSSGEVKGKVTGAWNKSKKIKPPTIKPPTK
jgi:hypothetical protein